VALERTVTEPRVNIWIVGDAGRHDEYNPFEVIGRPPAAQILYALNRGINTVPALADLLSLPADTITESLEAMARLGAVYTRGGRWKVVFPIFTGEDRDAIDKTVRPLAEKMAARLWTRRDDLCAVLGTISAAAYTPIDMLLLAIVGCFALDWGGLDWLKARGLLVHGKPQPGGRCYVLLGSEPGATGLNRLAGSRNPSYGHYTFTSFGDYDGRRLSVAEIPGVMNGAVAESESVPESWREPLRSVVAAHLEKLMLDLACVLEATAARPASVVELAARLDLDEAELDPLIALATAVGALRAANSTLMPAIPVFLPDDEAAMQQAVSMVLNEAMPLVEAGYPALRKKLTSLKAIRQGLPFGEVFSEVWHALFGQVNETLADSGFMMNPPRPQPDAARHIAWLSCFKRERWGAP